VPAAPLRTRLLEKVDHRTFKTIVINAHTSPHPTMTEKELWRLVKKYTKLSPCTICNDAANNCDCSFLMFTQSITQEQLNMFSTLESDNDDEKIIYWTTVCIEPKKPQPKLEMKDGERDKIIGAMWADSIKGKFGTCAICNTCGGASTSFCKCRYEKFVKSVTDQQIQEYLIKKQA
jgi:hypothetical protein